MIFGEPQLPQQSQKTVSANNREWKRPIYILGLVFQIPATPPANYLTLALKGLGFDTFQTNLLTIPSTVLHGMFPWHLYRRIVLILLTLSSIHNAGPHILC